MSEEIISNNSSSFLKERKEKTYHTCDTTTLTPPFPINALVELSNVCNHKCVFCANPTMERQKGFLDFQVYDRFISDGVKLGLREVGLYTTGEPFVVKNIDNYIASAKQSGIDYVYITSNGALATPERLVSAVHSGLDSIKFSFNAGSRETYQQVHGVDDFDKVVKNIKFISKYRKKNNIDLKLIVSCIVTKVVEERDEKTKLKKLLLPYIDEISFQGVHGLMGQSLDQLSSIASGMTDTITTEKAKPCPMLWNRVHVSHEGYLSLCCVDFENSLVYADLNISSLEKSWHNAIITKMRKRHQSQELDGTLCKNCLYGTRDAVSPLDQGSIIPLCHTK